MSTTQTEPIVKEIRIEASPDTVFSFFTDPGKLTRWLCTEATLDPRPGGVNQQVHTGRDGQSYLMRGEFVEVSPPSRVVFTWGWEDTQMDTLPGSSTVEVTLEAEGEGTRLRLVHSGLSAPAAEQHDEGWDEKLEQLLAALA